MISFVTAKNSLPKLCENAAMVNNLHKYIYCCLKSLLFFTADILLIKNTTNK
uniref:Uncharacterized protein n=1 Tax=Anguilla anguilla TaxID=7936 RepID=A0A0E9XMW7_ANGAN